MKWTTIVTVVVGLLNRFLFVLQVFTEATPVTLANPESVVFYTNIWLDLIVCASFFSVWRSQMEMRLPPVSAMLSAPHVPLASSMINVLRRPLELLRRIENTDLKFSVDSNFQSVKPGFHPKTELNPGMAVSLILEKFTESFCDRVVPVGKDPRESKNVPFLVRPAVAADLPWLTWVRFLNQQYCDRFTSGSSQARSLLYTVLAVTVPQHLALHLMEFFGVVSKLMHSIDNQ
jgi:hypothetical protein